VEFDLQLIDVGLDNMYSFQLLQHLPEIFPVAASPLLG
jgi:hypothetical protein